jgi:hypothetical protein
VRIADFIFLYFPENILLDFILGKPTGVIELLGCYLQEAFHGAAVISDRIRAVPLELQSPFKNHD